MEISTEAMKVYSAMLWIEDHLPQMGATLDEVRDKLDLASRGTVHAHMQTLLRAGRVKIVGTGARKYVAVRPVAGDTISG